MAALLGALALAGCKPSDNNNNADAEKAAAAASASAAASALAAASARRHAPLPPLPNAIPAPADVAEPPADAEKTASGLASKVLTPGTGKDHPAAEDKVKVHYTGWSKDGRMFDSSVARKEPTSFALNRVIKGWTEGVQLMTVGEKTRFWIPGNMAYGDKPTRPGAPSGMLVFDIELIAIK
jgi:FKBP-type peptidyl-prolyl cis-trans isomerase